MNRDQIRRLIPHDGAMCLLETVVAWDAESIHCVSESHRNPEHPLRRDGQLAAVHLVEYAAQAAAIHHGLSQRQQHGPSDASPGGALTNLRDIELAVETLDDITERLEIRAQNLLGGATGLIYRFDCVAGGRFLASGQLTIVTNAGITAGGFRR